LWLKVLFAGLLWEKKNTTGWLLIPLNSSNQQGVSIRLSWGWMNGSHSGHKTRYPSPEPEILGPGSEVPEPALPDLLFG
jgi:hypothetical protein